MGQFLIIPAQSVTAGLPGWLFSQFSFSSIYRIITLASTRKVGQLISDTAEHLACGEFRDRAIYQYHVIVSPNP
jgi:hypothetical protein